MRAMILAAGRGERMGALTQATPKPLLKVAGQYLIAYSLYALRRAGIHDVVINVCYHADQIQAALGNGERYGVHIQYSVETTALETGGGILQALPLLGPEPFVVLSSDIISDYDLQSLPAEPPGLAHLVLVDNPLFHPHGDFCLSGRRIYYGKDTTYTFGNIGVYRPELFAHSAPGRFRLGELFKAEILNEQITGEHFSGFWHNVGTPAELDKVAAQADQLAKVSL
jgi:MurNAc alpha-1-phosphate uridylyltransferase